MVDARHRPQRVIGSSASRGVPQRRHEDIPRVPSATRLVRRRRRLRVDARVVLLRAISDFRTIDLRHLGGIAVVRAGLAAAARVVRARVPARVRHERVRALREQEAEHVRGARARRARRRREPSGGSAVHRRRQNPASLGFGDERLHDERRASRARDVQWLGAVTVRARGHDTPMTQQKRSAGAAAAVRASGREVQSGGAGCVARVERLGAQRQYRARARGVSGAARHV